MGVRDAGTVEAAAADLVTWQRRAGVAVLVCLFGALVLGWRVADGTALGLLAIGVGLSLLPILRARTRSVLRTPASPSEVAADLSSLRNPLTVPWFERAAAAEVDPGGRRATLGFESLLGSTTTAEVVAERPDDATSRLVLRRGDEPLLEATVDVEAVDGGSRVEVVTRRSRMRPREVATNVVLSGRIHRFYDRAGYDLVDTSTAVRLRNPLG